MEALDPKNNQEVDAYSSDDEPLQEEEDNKPEYKNIIYHDSNSQVGAEERYISENKEIGRDIKGAKTSRITQISPKGSIINKAFKSKSSLMSIFP